jgi:hypothetical protein
MYWSFNARKFFLKSAAAYSEDPCFGYTLSSISTTVQTMLDLQIGT